MTLLPDENVVLPPTPSHRPSRQGQEPQQQQRQQQRQQQQPQVQQRQVENETKRRGVVVLSNNPQTATDSRQRPPRRPTPATPVASTTLLNNPPPPPSRRSMFMQQIMLASNDNGNTTPISPWDTAVYRYNSYSKNHKSSKRRKGKKKKHKDQRNNDENENTTTSATTTNNSTSTSTSTAGEWHVQMRRVGRQAALHTKTLVWDSNETTVNAAAGLVDHWEEWYRQARAAVVWSVSQGAAVYCAAKEGALHMEQGVLQPVRDWLVLPAFWGVEHAVAVSADFVASPAARQLASAVVHHAAAVPVVGPHVLAPTLVFGALVCQRTWHIVQYPIPSKHQVRQTVDACLNTTKWALSSAAGEVVMFCKRADAIISRTLSQTQWNLLGSGPYMELDAKARTNVLQHLCERYLEIVMTTTSSSSNHRSASMARYEWMARIRHSNPPLAVDLAQFLLVNCAQQVRDDEWLQPCPVYRHLQRPYLLPEEDDDDDQDEVIFDHELYKDDDHDWHVEQEEQVALSYLPRHKGRNRTLRRRALWFYQPAVNGKAPTKDTPWIPFSATEQGRIEKQFEDLVLGKVPLAYGTWESNLEDETQYNPLDDTVVMSNRSEDRDDDSSYKDGSSSSMTGCSTMAHWYAPNPVTDILVDQKRQCVTLMAACPECGISLEVLGGPPRVATPPSPCRACRRQMATAKNPNPNSKNAAQEWTPPPHAVAWPSYTARRRPTLWRFYGTGDVVRRSVWFLDHGHKNAGLQPFDAEASRILEDAYWFLQWMSLQENHHHHYSRFNTPNDSTNPSSNSSQTDEKDEKSSLDGALLTVEVTCPDGASRLVQFSSLSQATAIHKGLGAAFALRKRRVYRGAWLGADEGASAESSHTGTRPTTPAYPGQASSLDRDLPLTPSRPLSSSEAFLPDVPLRHVLTPPVPPTPRSSSTPFVYGADHGQERHDLSSPPSRFHQADMAKYWIGSDDEDVQNIDHLCLIVHGIGEMLRSIDVFGLSLPNLASIVDCCGYLRRNHAAVSKAEFSQMYPKAGTHYPSTTEATSTTPGRVEYLPVEWHEAFSVVSQRRLRPPAVSSSSDRPPVLMQDISLRTIPNMRDFANDTLMDVLYFMSPQHHDIMIDIVTREMNTVVSKFCQLTGFRGRISVVGHSLGSILSFDILANQNIDLYVGDQEGFISGVASQNSLESFASARSTERNPEGEETEDDTEPELSVPSAVAREPQHGTANGNQGFVYPQLDFEVDNFFLLGSPVAVFLMIRNQQQPLRDDYYLRGCHRVFNIFHPYDPVAYRIEPCIDPRNAEFEPTIMPHWNGGFRVQYQTKRLWRKLLDTTHRTQQNVVEAFEASMAGMGLLDTTGEAVATEDSDDDETSTSESSENRPNHVLTGQLNQGRRIDYMLQEREIEHANEYVAALAAHSSYWVEKDLSLFIARQIYLSNLERAIQYDYDDEPTWLPIDHDV